MSDADPTVRVLEDLMAVIESRRRADPESSYTAKLLAGGAETVARKLGEEAVEVTVAALAQSPQRVAEESADLLYHLLVLWAERDVSPADVWRELARRRGTSGLEEKARRGGD